MKDVRTYTRASAPQWAYKITAAIRAGDLDNARRLFRAAAAHTTVEDAIYATAATVEPRPNEITVGEAPMVFGNPLRGGYAWRCGHCLHTYRSGGRSAVGGVNLQTLRGALTSARKHAADDHADKVTVTEVTW